MTGVAMLLGVFLAGMIILLVHFARVLLKRRAKRKGEEQLLFYNASEVVKVFLQDAGVSREEGEVYTHLKRKGIILSPQQFVRLIQHMVCEKSIERYLLKGNQFMLYYLPNPQGCRRSLPTGGSVQY